MAEISNDIEMKVIAYNLQPKQIINFILSNKGKFILIRGNHEDLMEEMIKRNNATFGDLSNGTSYTIVD